MDGLIFLAVRCFSCQVFQVNQRTKSGKWKCSMCAESQSIVKIWGRGGRAKDVRRLVMKLNAAAGGGEDPDATLGSFSSQLEARDASGERIGGSSPLVPRRAFSGEFDRSCAGWGQRKGFVSARFAQSGEVTTRNSWDESRSETIHGNSRGGRSWDGGKIAREPGSDRPAMSTTIGSDREIDQQVIASAASSSGRSRWGVFATSNANTFLERSSAGTHQEVEEDLTFVTSLPGTKNTNPRTDGRQGRGKKRSLQAASDVSRKHPASHSTSAPRWTVGKQRDSALLEDTLGGEDPEIRRSARQRRGQNEVFIPGTDRASTDPWATAAGPIERRQPNKWGSLDTIGNVEYSYRRHDSDQLAKPSSRTHDDSRMKSAGAVGGDASSSRWSKFIG